MLTSFALKLNTLFSGGIIPSLFGENGDVVQTADSSEVMGSTFLLLAEGLVNLVLKLIYTCSTFVLCVIELLQFAISKILGLTVDISDYTVLDMNSPFVKIITSDAVLTTFKIVVGVSIILIIIFTIFSIVKSEYAFAVSGENEAPSKGRILSRTLRSFFTMGIFPLMLLFVVILVNAILAGFNDILRGGENTTIAGQIFISSAYSANNYRNYADDNVRVPIVINFDDPISNGQQLGYTTEQLAKIYTDFSENTGKQLYENFAYYNFPSFTDTVTYKNNRVYNQNNYTGFEKFVCTREQYYVMADFIDYAIKNNITYYVKSMTDVDINWKYVNSSIYDKENRTLKITYKDASNLNDGKSYTVTYAPSSLEISTPISDALDTISAILAIGDYKDNIFNILNRLEDTINVVEWETEKVFIQLSKPVRDKLNNAQVVTINDLTEVDKIILYERARYKYNNSLDASIKDIIDGVELPLKKLEKRVYQGSSSSYIQTDEYYVVELNGTYYQVEKNTELKDDLDNLRLDEYGEHYYTLIEPTLRDSFIFAEAAHMLNPDDDTVNLGSYKGVSVGYLKLAKKESLVEVTPTKVTGKVEETVDGVTYTSLYDDRVSEVIKKINWPQKLINDLQTIYSNININQLIATDKWLEQLGEYYGGEDININGASANVSSALIHPLGLIMSELFLSELEEPDNYNTYGSVKYVTKFDEKTLRALMLSLVGEQNYFQLLSEFKYFIEIFNVYMGPVLDEIAYFENFDLVNGSEASIQLYSYKAYMASIMLSSSMANWMYETAINLLGNNELTDRIINPIDGSYFYSEDLSSVDKTTIQATYNNYIEKLKDQFIEEGDPAYPEFMYALYDYMHHNVDDYVGFDGRIEAVLTSYYSDVIREKISIEEYYKVKKEYQNVINYLDSLVSSNNITQIEYFSIVEMINEQIVKPVADYEMRTLKRVYDENGKFISKEYFDFEFNEEEASWMLKSNNAITYSYESHGEIVLFNNVGESDTLSGATIRQTIKDLKNIRNCLSSDIDPDPDIVEQGELYIYFNELTTGILSTSEINEIKNRLNNYFNAVDIYSDKKLDFYTSDDAHRHAGQRKTLVEKLEELAINIQKLYEDQKSIIEDYDEIYFNARESEENPISNLVHANTRAEWDAISARFVKLETDIQAKIETLNPESDAQKISDLQLYLANVKSYIQTQDAIDDLNRYNIRNGLEAIGAQEASTSFSIVINNQAYTIGQNFTKAKFIEYVLGYEYLNSIGYDTVFVEDYYKGLVTKNDDGSVSSYNTLYDFVIEVGDMSATLYQMTNLLNLSAVSKDEIIIGATSPDENDLSQVILEWVLNKEYLPADLICAFFDIDTSNVEIVGAENSYVIQVNGVSFGSQTYETQELAFKSYAKIAALAKVQSVETEAYIYNNEKLNTVLSYLLLSDPEEGKANYVDYTKLTLKDLRLQCVDVLISYEEQKGESAEQNQQRYLAVLALACSDWYTYDNPNTAEEETVTNVLYTAKNNTWSFERRDKIKGLTTSNQSQATILRLAGLDNRPYEELVGAEYTINFDTDGIDEASGDVFVICTFDEKTKTYIPFMMSNNNKREPSQRVEDQDGYTWQEKFGYRKAYTEYYYFNDNDPTTKNDALYYPIVAKGVVTSDGLPTAIREVDGNIEYYRDNVVIHDVSDIGLSSYFVSPDQIAVHYTALSYVANAVSKAATGKSLVEHLASSIPRFAADSNYNFCYGTNEELVDKSLNRFVGLSFNFDKDQCIRMDNLYDLQKMNIIVLLIGTTTMLTALWKCLWGATGRIFDVTVLFLIGPAVISTISLRTDGKDKDGNLQETSEDSYSRWKETLTEKLLNVFSYAIGFNIFFIVVPIISEVNIFESEAAYTTAFGNLPLFRSLKVSFVNELGRLVFLIAAGFLSTRAPALFSKILKVSNGFDAGTETLGNVKNTVNELKDHVSGAYAIDQFDNAIDTAKNLIPGYAIGKKVATGVKHAATKVALKGAEMYMRSQGVPPEVAKKMTQELERQMKEKEQQKELHKAKRKAKRQMRDQARDGKKPDSKAYDKIVENEKKLMSDREKRLDDITGIKGDKARQKLRKLNKKRDKADNRALKSEMQLEAAENRQSENSQRLQELQEKQEQERIEHEQLIQQQKQAQQQRDEQRKQEEQNKGNQTKQEKKEQKQREKQREKEERKEQKELEKSQRRLDKSQRKVDRSSDKLDKSKRKVKKSNKKVDKTTKKASRSHKKVDRFKHRHRTKK